MLLSASIDFWYRQAKRFVREIRDPLKEINLDRDPKVTRDSVRKAGQTGVPVIKIGNRWIVVFGTKRREKELWIS